MNTKEFILLLFSSILFLSFISIGSAIADKHYFYYNDVRYDYTLDSNTKIENQALDENGIIINATIDHGVLENKSFFNAKIVNYNAVEFTVLEEQSESIDLIPVAERINQWLIDPVFWLFMGFFFALCFRAYFYLMHEPWIKCRDNKDLRMKNIGRLSQERPLNNTGLWVYTVKSANGIVEYYSDRSFSEYAPFLFEKFMGILHYYPELVVMDVDVPKDSGIKNYQFKRTTKNKFLKIIYAFCIGLSLIKWSIWLYNKMEKSDEPINKIKFITSLFLMEHLDLRLNIKYSKFEISQETGDEIWVEKNAENITLGECLAIQKTAEKVKDFQYLAIDNKFMKFRTADECFRDLRSRLYDRSYFEAKKIFYERQVENTYQLYQQVAEELTTMKLTEEERFHTMYSKIESVNTDRNNSLPELLSKYNRYRELGMDEKEVIQKVVLEKWEKDFGSDNKKLSQENAELKARINVYERILKEKLEKMDKNQINIRREIENKENNASEDKK